LVALSCEASIPSASLNGHIAFTDRLTGPTFPERDMFRRDRLTTGHIQCHDQLAWVYEGDMHVGDVLPNSNLFLFLFCSIKFSAHGESIRGAINLLRNPEHKSYLHEHAFYLCFFVLSCLISREALYSLVIIQLDAAGFFIHHSQLSRRMRIRIIQIK
jgi:hypothetical protein